MSDTLDRAIQAQRDWLAKGNVDGAEDITRDIRNGLHDAGIDFSGLTWLDTEAVVEAAIAPLRNEIIRLRNFHLGEHENV